MKFIGQGLVIAALLGGLGAASADPTPESRAIGVRDYTVFVDPPSGFVFVKLPQRWQFVGRVDGIDAAKLPSNVVSALLMPEIDPPLAQVGEDAQKIR
jgi:hypothetical protein